MSTQATKVSKGTIIKWLVTIGVPLCLFLIPETETYSYNVKMFLVVTVLGILMVAFEQVHLMAVSMLFPIGYIVSGLVPMDVAYSAWLQTMPLVVIGGYMIAMVLNRVGLLKRMAYWCFIRVRGSYYGLLYSVFIVGCILNTVTGGNAWVMMAAFTFGLCMGFDLGKSIPIVVVPNGKIVTAIDDVTKKEETKPACRSYKILELDPKGTMVRMWISNALDTTNDMLWHTKDLYQDIVKNVGPVPPVSLIGGEEVDLVRDVFIPSWDHYCEWQADCLNYLAENGGYEVMFSHLHNVDCAGHQLWHLGKTLEPWKHTNEKDYQACIVDVYRQTDDYLGRFLHFLDEDWTVLIVSDHGLIVGEEVPPLIGEYGGLNVPIMEQLGYTVMKKDENGNSTGDVDWEKTRAVQIRSNYIYINLKGRDKYGIVDPADKYALEEQIINDLYNYRDPATGRRVIGICLRNKDGVLIGVNGPECGDIFFSIEEGFNRLHGDSLSTSEGYFNTSVSPLFIAAGPGVKENFKTPRTIRQVDVTPTVAALLGVRFPAQCEGAPVYQILSEEF